MILFIIKVHFIRIRNLSNPILLNLALLGIILALVFGGPRMVAPVGQTIIHCLGWLGEDLFELLTSLDILITFGGMRA